MTYPYNNALKVRVMRRVYGIWFVKRVFPWVVLEVGALALFMYYIRANVSITNVAQNIIASSKAHPLSVADFIAYAFMHTEAVVQLAAIGLVFIGALVVRQAFRSVRGGVIFGRSNPMHA